MPDLKALDPKLASEVKPTPEPKSPSKPVEKETATKTDKKIDKPTEKTAVKPKPIVADIKPVSAA